MLFSVYIAHVLTGHMEQSTPWNCSGMTEGITFFKQKSRAVSLSSNTIKYKSAHYVWMVIRERGQTHINVKNSTEGILESLD